MEADIHAPGRSGGQQGDRPAQALRYRLDHRSTLRSHYPASAEYDSRLEADFAAEFEAKFGGAKRKWVLAREDEIIPVSDTVMIPDFSFTHIKDGRRALVEIAGLASRLFTAQAWKLRQANGGMHLVPTRRTRRRNLGRCARRSTAVCRQAGYQGRSGGSGQCTLPSYDS
jgi:predicted nuclease of restriction endonuclease-like RecB superfamily